MNARAFEAFCKYLHDDTVGIDHTISTPLGKRKLVYADFTASGRALKKIEEYIEHQVLPCYGNVHSLSTSSARQCSYFREEAREIVRNYFRGTASDAFIFTGNGATGAAGRLVEILSRNDWNTRELRGIRETRWKTFVCDSCQVQLLNESEVKVHLNSYVHKSRCANVGTTTHAHTSSVDAHSAASRRVKRVVVFVVDSSLHHSSFLPFKEMKAYQREDEMLEVEFLTVFIDLDPNTATVNVTQLITALNQLQKIRATLERDGKEHEKGDGDGNRNKDGDGNRNKDGDGNKNKDGDGDVDIQVNVITIMNACSNVTGLKVPIQFLSEEIKSRDSLVFWDYASAVGSTDPIDLQMTKNIDAIFVSPHKLLGGVGTCGILGVKKNLVAGSVPGLPGGGTVTFVSKSRQIYTVVSEHREEAGTPNVVACIRAGLVFRLLTQVPHSLAQDRETMFLTYVLKQLNQEKKVHVLGPLKVIQHEPTKHKETTEKQAAEKGIEGKVTEEEKAKMEKKYELTYRKACVSFMIKYGNNDHVDQLIAKDVESTDKSEMSFTNRRTSGGLYLHHNYVSALLNDVFGIQSRPGCACAGPLAHALLGWSPELTERFADCLELTGAEVLRPGFVRISLHASLTWDEVELIAAAIRWVANEGWKLLPFYSFNNDSGEWTQTVVKPKAFRQWLSHVSFLSDSRIEQAAAEDVTTSLRRKDPRKLAGAVAMPGLDLKTLISTRAALKSTEKRKTDATPCSSATPSIKPVLTASDDLTPGARKGSTKALTAMFEKKAQEPVKAPGLGMRPRRLFRRSSDPDAATCPSDATTDAKSSVETMGGDKETPAVIKPVEGATKETLCKETPLMETPCEVVESEEPDTEFDRRVDALVRECEDEIPADVHALYVAANSVVESLTNVRGGGGTEALRRRAQGLSPLLPGGDWIDLLWFALPGDALVSLAEGEPRLADPSKDAGSSPRWDAPLTRARPVDSIFEVRQFAASLESHNARAKVMAAASVDTAVATRIVKMIFHERLPMDRGNAKRKVSAQSFAEASIEESVPEVAVDTTTESEVKPEVGSQDASEMMADRVCSEEGSCCAPLGASREETASAEQLSTEEREFACCLEGEDGIERKFGGRLVRSPCKLKIPRKIGRTIGRAIEQFDMIQEGDRILVGLSGGKDSLSLLHCLKELSARSPVKFEVAAATVDPQTPEYNPYPLVDYLEGLGITYHMLSYPIIELAKQKLQKDSLCSFCARMKRGLLYACMRKHKYNKLALGQHLDDIAESFLMSAFYNGTLNTMKANYTPSNETLRVIRPLIYTREKDLASFASENNFPVIEDNCPACFASPTERLRMKHLLAKQEFEFPQTINSISKALLPLMSVDVTDKKGLSSPVSHSDDVCGGMCPRL